MDIALIKTFLEVSAASSFGGAAERLQVTQSAVSLRIQRLEDILGRPLFTRSKAGAFLTPAGAEFEHYALSILKIWEEARQQVVIPEGFKKSLTIGAQYSLWPRLGFRMVDGLRIVMPELSLRTELGMTDRLTRMLTEGIVQIALMYTPMLRPGLIARPLLQEELALFASWPDPVCSDLKGRYLFIDWGPEFVQFHGLNLPDLSNQGMAFSLEAMAAEFISRRDYAGYLPTRYAKRYCDSGQLYPVPDMPTFPYPAWTVLREDLDPQIATAAERVLAQVVTGLDQETHEQVAEFRHLNMP
ncbi:HTH-type transcriptional regulator GltR [Defluviimonas aquaemixtae]|uniref:HTH-type transcriptional regulator GltR n=1 Tax=Albidovulum aquaemixtae TaxID=1542388 RepID=A0A2R8BNH5_9RHOB|nr:LysR family transcriptional regulator [Defluviimonas aquaemixtae]SPH24916.1 HTH-type transcriptional regulator GltR [Defluviimonas aquaemixtae]